MPVWLLKRIVFLFSPFYTKTFTSFISPENGFLTTECFWICSGNNKNHPQSCCQSLSVSYFDNIDLTSSSNEAAFVVPACCWSLDSRWTDFICYFSFFFKCFVRLHGKSTILTFTQCKMTIIYLQELTRLSISPSDSTITQPYPTHLLAFSIAQLWGMMSRASVSSWCF